MVFDNINMVAKGYQEMGEINREHSEEGIKSYSLLESDKYESEIKNYDISEEYINAFKN